MSHYRLSRAAEFDLEMIFWHGLENFGAARTERYVTELEQTFDYLSRFPEATRLRTEMAPPVRAYPQDAHVIIYEIEDENIVILRIRSARELDHRSTGRHMTHSIHIGIGGWTYEPWRGVFYPADLTQKRELAFASRALTSIEINGTYYSGFKPETWMKWRDETPDGFIFAVKASRFCTNRKVLSEGNDSLDRFLDQGLTALGDKLGPINWQFMATKKFDPVDFEGFLKLLPREKDGVRLRHALEVRSGTFDTPQFHDLARKYGAAIIYAVDDEAPQWPRIDQETSDFRYARLMSSREDEPTGMNARELDAIADQTRAWAKRGDVFAYFIAGAKVRNPAAARALIEKLG